MLVNLRVKSLKFTTWNVSAPDLGTAIYCFDIFFSYVSAIFEK